MNCEGNMFLSKLCGAKMYCINMDLFKSDTNESDEAFRPRKEELAEQIRLEIQYDTSSCLQWVIQACISLERALICFIFIFV